MSPTSTETKVIRALSHPVRRQVMTLLSRGESSPKDLAEAIGMDLGVVSYHVKILRDLGLIKVVREVQRRGAVQRFYKPTSGAVTVRHVIQWLLDADRTSPKGWKARTVVLDDEGLQMVDAALARLWKDVDKAEAQSARRAVRDEIGSLSHAVGVIRAPIDRTERPG